MKTITKEELIKLLESGEGRMFVLCGQGTGKTTFVRELQSKYQAIHKPIGNVTRTAIKSLNHRRTSPRPVIIETNHTITKGAEELIDGIVYFEEAKA